MNGRQSPGHEPPPGDEPRDAHLLAALRHAPDRDEGAPPALSARILAQARGATAPVDASRPGWWERAFGWLSQPVTAGAFATVLIAGVVGLMWRGGPPPEALPGGDRPAEPVAAVSDAPPPAGAMAESRTTASAPATVDDTTTPPATAPRAVRRPEGPTPQAAPAPAPVPAPAPAPAPAPVPAPAAAPAPAPAPAPLAQAPAPAAAPAPSGLARPAPQAATKVARSDAAHASRDVPERSDGAAPFDPLVPALAALSAGGAPDRPLFERLSALRARVIGPWQAAPATAVPDQASPVVDTQGRAWGRWWMQGLQLYWQDREGQVWRAALKPAAAEPGASAAPAR